MQEVIRKINAIYDLRCSIAELKSQKESVEKPLFSSYDDIEKIYHIYLKLMKDTKENRMIFLFVVIYFYCPDRLWGSYMKKQLRKKIASTTGMQASFISAKCNNLRFYYTKYSEFRDNADALIKAVKREMEVKE